MQHAAVVQELRQQVVRRYGVPAASVRVVRAPYRICPLGAHIDHQLGPVTAMAIDRAVHVAFAPSRSPQVRLCSLDFPGEASCPLDDIPSKIPGDWGNFVRGAACVLGRKHRLRTGILGLISGPLSAGGLSSSAAVSVALLLALEDANRIDVSPKDNILLGQAIENDYLGLHSGILDQSAILLSRRDHLTVIDCESVRHTLIPSPRAMPPVAILITFSGLRKPLVGTDYNRRVAECTEAAAVLLQALGRDTVRPLLGHVRGEEYEAHKHRLDGAPARRAAHYFSEVDRVQRGAEAWKRGDVATVGRLMTASGASSIRNYECGAPPLVRLYEILAGTQGVYGTRFSGAGFRGCCVALVAQAAAHEAAESVRREYSESYPELADKAVSFLCRSDDGAQIL